MQNENISTYIYINTTLPSSPASIPFRISDYTAWVPWHHTRARRQDAVREGGLQMLIVSEKLANSRQMWPSTLRSVRKCNDS